MKIGMLVNNMEVSGGYQKLVIRLAQHLAKKGNVVTIYTLALDRKNCYPEDINSVNIKSLSPKEGASGKLDQFQSLAKTVPRDLDAIIVHDPLSLYVLAFTDIEKGTRVIWMLNNQFSPADIGVTTRAEVLKAKISRRPIAQPDNVAIVRKGLSKVAAFATYDAYNKKLVRKYLHNRATVVYAGADLERFKKYAGARSFAKKRKYTFLSVGVAFPHRRYEDIIEAVSLLKARGVSCHTLIVGRQDLHEEYADKLKKLVSQKNVGDVITFKNYVSDSEMVRLYKESDAFIFVNDGFTWGIAVFEAVAAKLPVIITSNIGAADLIKGGSTGWVVEPRDPAQIAQAIEQIISNRGMAEKVADEAYKEIADFVSWEAYTNRMLDLIERQL